MGREGRGKAFSHYELAKEGLDQSRTDYRTRPASKESPQTVVLDIMRNFYNRSLSNFLALVLDVLLFCAPFASGQDLFLRCCSMRTVTFMLISFI